MRKHTRTLGCCLSALTAAFLSAQGADSHLTRLRNLHLPESPGSVPVMYVPSAKKRALRYQKELQNANAWFEEQLWLHVPMVLAVLDRDHYQAQVGHWPLPWSEYGLSPGIVYFPSLVEELVGSEPQAKTPGEYITYHEAGHIFAAPLRIRSGNSFVNELIANVFMAAYILAKRPDLQWVLKGPPSHFEQTPRYTSLADLDYVYTGVGAQNYAWFQYHLIRIAGFMMASQKFPSVIERLQGEFPAATQKQETLDRIIGHLDAIRPGVRDMLGTLAGPTTLPPFRPSVCTEAGGGALSPDLNNIAVRNDTARPLTLVTPQGGNETVAAGSWRMFEMRAGASIKLLDGTCIVAGDKPALAIVDQQ